MNTKLLIFSVLLFTSVVNSQVTRSKNIDNLDAPKAIPVIDVTVALKDEDVNVPFSVLEVAPKFKTCKDSIEQDAKSCFFVKMNEHIAKNLKYPKEAKNANIQGRIITMFIINKKGEVQNLQIKGTRNEGSHYLEAESERIIKLLPKFIPGMQRGKLVNVSLAIPIIFKLDDPIKDIEQE